MMHSHPQHRHSISIPSAEIEITLDNLVSISLRKNFHPLTFSKLFKEFKHKLFTNNPEHGFDMTPLYQNCSANPLQLKYIYEILIKSELNNDFEELTKLFTVHLLRLSKTDQVVILIYFNQIYSEIPWSRLVENEKFLAGFSKYLKVVTLANISLDVDSKYIFMICKFIANLLSNSTKVDDAFNESILEFLEFLKVKEFDASYEFLNSFYANYSFSTVKNDYQLSTNLQKDMQGPQNNAKILKLKKILWLSQQVTVDFAPMNEKFIKGLKSLLNLSTVATSATNSSIAYELISTLFDCLTLSTPKTKPIWLHFILNKLPQLLKSLKMNQQKLSNSLLNTFETLDFGKHKSLIIQLLKNLISFDLIKPAHFIKLSPNQTDIIPATPIFSNEDLTHLYNNKFHETNPEFITIQEAEIESFINKVSSSVISKETFSNLVGTSINRFIADNDSLRLKRLLISLTMNNDVFEYILLQGSPYAFLEPIVGYFGRNVDKCPESSEKQIDNQDLMMDLDLGASDSTNIQDFFTDFGAVLIFVQYATSHLCLDPAKVTMNKKVSNILMSSVSTVSQMI
ncbi:unnamed protein product [Ambrosiozyma monospora]|uniref:Unnamed protein product n=1 Tax=Ambrosiozyma monospora TaxID=43982 RepID=A0ACB5T1T9_AMBMO|nr:unnamed protein product [Ambrosiozyma monospora]